MDGVINIARNNASIDALILTKDKAVPGIAETYGLSPSKMAYIGDETTDLPIMRTPGLGFIGAPANAQDRVAETVRSLGGYVSGYPFFDGFADFYDRAKKRGIELVVSDKDGVLKDGGDMRWGPRFKEITLKMGQEGRPNVCVLTGSTLEQNREFMQSYGLTPELGRNPAVRDHPYMLILEAGAIHVNVLTGEIINYVGKLNPELLAALKGPFETEVMKRIEETIMRDMHFTLSRDHNEQTGRVYVPLDKKSMFSVNVPRRDVDGTKFRDTVKANLFRDSVIDIMTEVADRLNLPYHLM